MYVRVGHFCKWADTGHRLVAGRRPAQGNRHIAPHVNRPRLLSSALAGQVKVYRNGTLLATRDVTGWPYYAEGGYIGLWFINAGDAVLDDFGGGTAAQASLGPDGGRARGLAAPDRSSRAGAPRLRTPLRFRGWVSGFRPLGSCAFVLPVRFGRHAEQL